MKNFRTIIELIAGISVILGFGFAGGALNSKVERSAIEIQRVESKHDTDMREIKIDLAQIHQLQFEMNGTLRSQSSLLRQLARAEDR